MKNHLQTAPISQRQTAKGSTSEASAEHVSGEDQFFAHPEDDLQAFEDQVIRGEPASPRACE